MKKNIYLSDDNLDIMKDNEERSIINYIFIRLTVQVDSILVLSIWTLNFQRIEELSNLDKTLKVHPAMLSVEHSVN